MGQDHIAWLLSQAWWEPRGRWLHSLVQQGDGQAVLAIGAVAEHEVGLAALAGLHLDVGLDLCLHVHLHDGLDDGPGRGGA